MKSKLGALCSYVKEKVKTETLDKKNYISTENMLPNKGGITLASSLPSTEYTSKYQAGDILISNIRPYFKKIWKAEYDGGCSNDVLVLRANDDCYIDFLYYALASDSFFDYATATAKGTKMPRGDKTAIMDFEVPYFDFKIQVHIAGILKSLDEKIALNNKINENLGQQINTLFKMWFIDLAPFGGIRPSNWSVYTLGEVTKIGAGSDKPERTARIKSDKFLYPVYSNGLDDEGLYGYTDKAKIFDESVTVSARGTIGYVCLRHVPYVPIVRLITLIPDTNILNAKYLYLYLKRLNITGTGTTQQQLTVPDFSKTEILIPDKQTMDAFTEYIEPMFEAIWNNENENNILAKLRDTLLPKLMNGELDVLAV